MKARGVKAMLAGLICFIAAGQWHGSLIDMRSEFQLQHIPPEDTTPLVALTTVAFGGFRGLVADLLWIRASKLQEEGQFFELVQLSKWISQLEPRVPEVWSYQSWNLAYNVSVLFPEHGDRWRWVNHGVDLLRKEGLTHNPVSDTLHWDLGWMFQHKIGMRFDEAHPRYKQELAAQVSSILPGGFLPDTGTKEQKEALYATFTMDMARMQELNTLYGPIDWRVPEAHSLYWAHMGEPYARNTFQRRSLLRMRYGSLRALMTRGTLLGDPTTGKVISLPRPDLIPVLIEEVAFMLEEDPGSPLVRTYAALLEDCVLLLTENGQLEEAGRLYEDLKALPQFASNPLPEYAEWLRNHMNRPVDTLPSELAMMRVVAMLRIADRMPPEALRRAMATRRQAQLFHDAFQRSRQGEEHRARTGLPPWETMVELVADAPPF